MRSSTPGSTADFPSGAAARELLSGFEGLLQTDAYAGYEAVALPGSVMRVGCVAHIRRKFHEARHSASTECGYVFDVIAKLYEVEEKAKKLSHDERLVLRTEEAKPEFDERHDYLVKLSASTLPESPLRKAVNYALSEWEPMSWYIKNGHVEIDNNSICIRTRSLKSGSCCPTDGSRRPRQAK